MSDQRSAILHRMVLAEHECPFGVRAKQLLDEAGFAVEEHLLTSREAVDAFQAKHGISTTPLIFIDGEQIGGSSELERYLAEMSAA